MDFKTLEKGKHVVKMASTNLIYFMDL